MNKVSRAVVVIVGRITGYAENHLSNVCCRGCPANLKTYWASSARTCPQRVVGNIVDGGRPKLLNLAEAVQRLEGTH